MEATTLDEKGRIVVPKKLRKKLGKKVYWYEVDEGMMLVAEPEDPLAELRELGRKLPDKSIEELKKEARKEAGMEL